MSDVIDFSGRTPDEVLEFLVKHLALLAHQADDKARREELRASVLKQIRERLEAGGLDAIADALAASAYPVDAEHARLVELLQSVSRRYRAGEFDGEA